jgi:hypothetical protein
MLLSCSSNQVGAEQSYEIDEPIELAEEKPYHIR